MKTFNKLFTAAVLISALFLVSFVQDDDTWMVPEKYKTMENPTENSSRNMKIGKMLYSKHCKSCHGNQGLGDGPKAASLDTYPGDFSSEEFQSQSDGELYYKTTFGRDEMPAYENTISSDEDRWLIVHYMRTFAGE
ncbi:MAG: c-type cytochrome [Bacteroidales bacterium]|nr:c-type cytochrome [Bacteroidales bacterium]MCF8343591.1 c-type cytochrome [Bacteroidales bacterium]MCF8351534.1 c-type cytochrome [Bacteroidales bacterium]MCF8377712.1 c-type cytochrome [Bacteroidales bacterium]MCF8402103.1 c-type cytochrome [Bacteroidales bacterium]